MGDQEIGEHSRKCTDSGDSERPFKKARYVWQLKGKYHLKESYKQSGNPDMKEGPSKDVEEQLHDSESVNSNNNNSSNSNNCNKCCLDTFIARSNALLEAEDTSDNEAPIDLSVSPDIERSDEIPVTLVEPNLTNHDAYLRKWQARQVAKCFVENTVNSLLEEGRLTLSDAEDFVETDYVEHLDSGGQVEDEGILMAIRFHGLQSSILQARRLPRDDRVDSFARDRWKCFYPWELLPLSSVDSYVNESTLDNFENAHNEIIKQKAGESEMSCDSDADGDEDSFNLEMNDPSDFLSAAVSVAIQKKGLSSYNYG